MDAVGLRVRTKQIIDLSTFNVINVSRRSPPTRWASAEINKKKFVPFSKCYLLLKS
jgi:hypothetical protein